MNSVVFVDQFESGECMLNEAIAYYHSLFDDAAARENDAALSAALQRGGLFFGTRPICVVLRPAAADGQSIHNVAASVLRW